MQCELALLRGEHEHDQFQNATTADEHLEPRYGAGEFRFSALRVITTPIDVKLVLRALQVLVIPEVHRLIRSQVAAGEGVSGQQREQRIEVR